jgi:hypothetical protein
MLQQGCAMRQPQQSILRHLWKAFQAQDDGNAHEPLPERWIDLIRQLDEKEQKGSEDPQSETKRRFSRPSSSH